MNKKNIIIFFVIFLTFILFAFAGYGWHFYKEEVDLIYAASKIKSLKDLLAVFLSGNVSGNAHPSNYTQPPLTFLTSFYRPLLFVFAFLQYTLIGMKPYIFYLLSIALHCINIPLMYTLLSSFTRSSTAIPCTLLFALHPSYAPWLGNANMQQYTISATGIILVALLIKKYLEQNRSRFLFGALTIFAITLFIRETIIITPTIIIWLSLLAIIPMLKGILLTTTFTFAALPYVIAKLLVFPLALTPHQTTTSFTNFSAKASLRITQSRTFLYDFLSISWLQGHPTIKVIITLALTLCIVLIFFKSTRKKAILASLGSMLLLLWPGILIGYFIPSRFFYEATPAYVITIGLLIENSQPYWQKVMHIIVGVLIIESAIFTGITVHQRTKTPTLFYNIIMKLKNSPLVKDQPLCFFDLPNHLSWTGLAQQLWLYKINNGKPIFVLIKTEPPWNNFPTDTIFITWDKVKNKFYVISKSQTKENFHVDE